MAKAPLTQIDFYEDTPLTSSSSPVFQTAAQRSAYWNARRTVSTLGNLYVRHTRGSIRVGSDALGSNYANITEISWLNTNYEGKTFYARVVDFEVVSNKTVEFFFEIDWFQTFMFDVKFYSSMIDREGLTEAEYALAVANPWRDDILELLTPEPDLPVANELEVSYRIPTTNVGPTGLISAFVDGAPESPVEGGGTPGLVKQWPSVSTEFPLLNDCTIVMALATFPMVGDPYGSTSGPFSFSKLTGPYSGNPSNANLSWITPVTGEFSASFGATTRPFYLIGIRLDGRVNAFFSRIEPTVDAGVADERLQRIVNLLAASRLSHMLVMGPVLVPNAILDADINLQSYWGSSAPEGIGAQVVPAVTGSYDDRGHPKLMRGPFRYVRAEGPDGQQVALLRERWVDPSNPEFVAYSDFDGDPTMTLMPFKYDGMDVDVQKRLSYGAFPTLAYGTDSYLAQLGQMKQEALMGSLRNSDALRVSGSGDPDYMNAQVAYGRAQAGYSSMLNPTNAGIVAQGNAALAGFDPSTLVNPKVAAAKGLADAIGASQTAASYASDRATADLTAQFEDAQIRNFARSGSTNDLPPNMLNNLKGAMVGTDFHAGNMASSMLSKFSRQGFKIYDVQLRDDIVGVYADYFTTYGYASGRLGIPKIVQGMRGGSMPRFESLDGQEITYCKTSNIKIAGVPSMARAAIETLFNGGHRFIKGW